MAIQAPPGWLSAQNRKQKKQASGSGRVEMAPLGRYVLIFGGFAAAVGLTLYPIFFYPMTHLGDYRLKVWSDPFGRK